MIKHFSSMISFGLAMLLTYTMAIAQPTTTPTQPSLTPSPPNLNVKAYVLMDANSGKILAEKNAQEKLPQASLTKMMTMYVVSQALQLGTISKDDQVRISKNAWKTGGSKMFIKVGAHVPINDLTQGIIVDSGNDACVAIAEHTAGTEEAFVELMNQTAANLNLTNTHYLDVTGLTTNHDHYSTAADLAHLARAIIRDFPEDYATYQQKWFTYNKIRQPNRNRLLWRYEGADGIKTGHTPEAGYCLVASAKRNGMRLISVILNAKTDEARASTSTALLNYGFRFYDSHLIYQGGSTISKPRIWFGEDKTVPAGLKQDLYATTPVGKFGQVKTTIAPQTDIKAPIAKGQPIGMITLTLNNEVIDKAPLIALAAVNKGSIFRRTTDHVAHLFHRWFGGNKPQSTQIADIKG